MNLEYLDEQFIKVPIADRDIARSHLLGALSVIVAEDEWQQAVNNAVAFALSFRTVLPK